MVSLWDYWRRRSAPVPKFDTIGGASSYALELTKRRPVVSLTSEGATTGTLRMDLTWRMRTSDVFGAGPKHMNSLRHPLKIFKPAEVQGHSQGLATVDFDLGCLYELTDGSKGVIQPLGGLTGDFGSPPYLKLSGDDRFGSASGETIYLNLDYVEEIKRLLVFVYIYDGTPAFSRADVVLTLVAANGHSIEIGLTEPVPQARSCAVALIEHEKGELIARREVRYVYGFQSEIDRLYGWGMSWGRGFKPSRLRT